MINRYCKNCGIRLKRHQYSFCSQSCCQRYRRNEYIKKWKNGEVSGKSGEYGVSRYIRDYLFEKYDSKCAICHWSEVNKFSGNIPLEVEHIDGNYNNNDESNLTLLCPNCHSLTATYKGLNTGNGRKERRKYSLLIKNADEVFKENGCSVYGSNKEKLKKHPCVICGTATSNKYCCSKSCEFERRKKENLLNSDRPTKQQLFEDLQTLPMTKIGEKYSVSDNAVRKWCKSYGLPFKSKDIKEFFSK